MNLGSGSVRSGRRRRRVACALALSAAAALAALPAFAHAPRGDDVDFARDVLPLLKDSCLDCHAGKEPEAGLSFESFAGEADARARPGVWRKVRDKLHAGEMPPPSEPRPDGKLLAAAQRWLDVRLRAGPGAWPIDAGRVTIRRLNRVEFENSVRDLFDTPLDVAAQLPPDDVGYGFDNMGDVLSVSPLLLEKYLASAERIAVAVLPGDELRRATVRHFEAEEIDATLRDCRFGPIVNIYSEGEVFTSVDLPRDSDYVLRVRAFGQQAGPEPVRMVLRAGRHDLAEVVVAETEEAPATFEARARLAHGRQRIAAAFRNDYYHPEDPDPAQRDRNLVVDWLELEGPLDELPPTASEKRIYVCAAAADSAPHVHVRACAPAILQELASRAWRRPAQADEVARLLAPVDAALAAGEGFAHALRPALAALLISPNFLFRSEIDAAPDDARAVHPLDDFELASRLSYFLWSSLPDDALRAKAADHSLHDDAVLAGEVRRLLRDVRAGALVANFASQWLQLRSLARATPDGTLFPDFDEGLREAMRLETELFVDAVFREGRPVRELVDADFTFLNERLARHYGIEGVAGDRMRRVRLRDATRGGVLTQASLLTLTSNPARTSPVKRGKFLLERILAAPTPPPPPGVGALDESPHVAAQKSMKERLAAHRKDPACAVCHEKMDALGFALERFGPTGAWRERDGAHEVDDAGELPDGRALAGPAGLKRIVLSDDRFERCLAQHLFTYAVGRGPTDDDLRSIGMLVESFGGRSPSFEELVAGLVQLDAFRRRRGESPTPAPAASGG
jgi:hypothetical protein